MDSQIKPKTKLAKSKAKLNKELTAKGLPGWMQPRKQHVGPPYTEQTITELSSKLVAGQSLRQACHNQNMPSYEQVCVWVHSYPEVANSIHEALQTQARIGMTEIMDISDGENELSETKRDVLRVKARQEQASVLLPDLYGKQNANVEVIVNLGDALEAAKVRRGVLLDG